MTTTETAPSIAVFDHPAKFSRPVLEQLQALLDAEDARAVRPLTVFDPFAGTGLVHTLGTGHGLHTVGVELEPEWAACHPRTVQGNALHLPFAEESMDGLVTSPCLEQSHLVLTSDLRWVPVGSIEVGDELLAYDENSPGLKPGGQPMRRRYQRAEVVRSVPRRVRCVRVILDNGDEIVTTPEHPWLANRYSYKSAASTFVHSADLAGYWVMRQIGTWAPLTSYDAGWLAGMFDGEGSLSLGGHGSPKMSLCQVEGPVIDRAEKLMAEFGYQPNRIPRRGVPEHRQQVDNVYVTGGMPGMLRALGQLRPTRLLNKWAALPISSCAIQPDRVQVLGVEDAGMRDIQEIETTTGTYIGEGYLHHNCYGNRMADAHNAQDPCKACGGDGFLRIHESDEQTCKACKGSGLSKRNTYTHRLRVATGDRDRRLHDDNAGAMRWGKKYRTFHEACYREALRTIRPGGFALVNISNHLETKDGRTVEHRVSEWTMNAWLMLGVHLAGAYPVPTARQREGANGEVRAEFELVLHFRVPDPHPQAGRLF